MLPSYSKNNPHNHNLKWVEMGNEDGFICDECDGVSNANEGAWKCKACNYDLCDQCVSIGVSMSMSIRKRKLAAAAHAEADANKKKAAKSSHEAQDDASSGSSPEGEPPAKKQKQSSPISPSFVSSAASQHANGSPLNLMADLVSDILKSEVQAEVVKSPKCSQPTSPPERMPWVYMPESSSSFSVSSSFSFPSRRNMETKEMVEEEHKLKTLFWKLCI